MADQLFSVKSGFYNAVSGDRTYTADDMNKPYKRLVADGVFAANDGTPSSDLQAVASGSALRLTVQAGQAIVGGKWFENPTAIIIDVPANTALYGRIDSVIIRVDERQSARAGSVVYRTGEAASSPTAPALVTTAGVTEYRVANIAVASGATSVSGSDVTDLRGSSSCPWVTGLIQQVDTSTLWEQYQAAYAEQFAQYTTDFDAYLAIQRQAWEDFLASLTEELTVAPNVLAYRNEIKLLGAATDVNIGIASYDKDTDVLMVYVNGLQAQEGVDYTIANDSSKITLAVSLDTNAVVDFVVFKSVVTGDLASTVSLIMALDSKVDGFMTDTGWTAVTLTGNTVKYSNAMKPYVRRVGSTVYIRGAVKGVTSGQLGTIPSALAPVADHYTAINGTYVKITSSGVISLVGSVGSTSTIIPLSTSYCFND